MSAKFIDLGKTDDARVFRLLRALPALGWFSEMNVPTALFIDVLRMDRSNPLYKNLVEDQKSAAQWLSQLCCAIHGTAPMEWVAFNRVITNLKVPLNEESGDAELIVSATFRIKEDLSQHHLNLKLTCVDHLAIISNKNEDFYEQARYVWNFWKEVLRQADHCQASIKQEDLRVETRDLKGYCHLACEYHRDHERGLAWLTRTWTSGVYFGVGWTATTKPQWGGC